MTMTPRLRKLVLTTHIVSSVGWFGAAAAYAALVIAVLRSAEAQQVRAVYLAIEPITWFAVVPLALASLLTGLIQSLGAPWGLVRHYWVIYKLVLTLFATTILLMNTQTVTALAHTAAATEGAELGGLKGQLLHASLGMLVLLLTTVLGVYKPQGMTRYGWRKQHALASSAQRIREA
jgi:hypothetical protein